MDDIAIKIENLSKLYRLGVVGSGTLSHDLKRWWTVTIRGKADPYLKIGEVNDRRTKANSEYVWALKDINLEIKKGDVVGVIGKNGAGKSTLLKILSKVTRPTTGTIHYKGRIASLLEVGTGFHLEMTGRENIYMNGSIMGMTRTEITRKLDEIIDFAGVERYIDTPVKRYSSGMTVRLGFAIAAHLEPEILVVDEVLAVGDAEFQKKAIGKMQDVSKGEGRTVLFVSHNMEAVSDLCEKSTLLHNGMIYAFGKTNDIIAEYIDGNFGLTSQVAKFNLKSNIVNPLNIYIHDVNFNIKDKFDISERIGISFEYEILQDECAVLPAYKFFNKNGINIFDTHENIVENDLTKRKGVYRSTVWILENFFNEGIVHVDAALLQPDPFFVFFHQKETLSFSIYENGFTVTKGYYKGTFPGIIRPALNWQTKKIQYENFK